MLLDGGMIVPNNGASEIWDNNVLSTAEVPFDMARQLRFELGVRTPPLNTLRYACFEHASAELLCLNRLCNVLITLLYLDLLKQMNVFRGTSPLIANLKLPLLPFYV